MEHFDSQPTSGVPAGRHAYAGMVGPGDLEVLLMPGRVDHIGVATTTSISGISATWQTQLARVSGSHVWLAAKIIISYLDATLAVIRLRLKQAFEALSTLAQL